MKNIFKCFAVLAAVASFFACQKEIDAPKEELKSTHKVAFVAGTPETKTTVSIDKANGVVDYAWTKDDESRFTVYEIKGEGTFVPASETACTLEDDGRMSIIADFEGSATAGASYIALFNSSVKVEQTSDEQEYDQDSDVLVSQVVKSESIEDEELYLSFKREVAMAVVTLKGLDKGSYLYNVKIESDKPLAGSYDLNKKTWEDPSNILSITSFNEIENGVASLYFVTVPVEDAMLKVTVETTDDADNVTATYVKEFTKSISFTRGGVRAFNANLEGCETLPEVEHTISWTSSSKWTSDTDHDTFSLTTQPYGYSVVLKKNNGTTAPTVNATDNDCRLYAKGTATISNAKNITKIVFNISTQGKKRLAPITASVGTIATQALGDETVVWTGKAKEITFTVGDNANYGSDGSNKAGQLDFSSIDVTYLDDGTPDPEPEQPTEYRISIDSEIIGGTVSADKEAAVAGAQITLSYEAAAGYEFGSWNVTSTGGSITVTDGKFTMPEADVNVSATFNKAFDGTITTMSAADGADIKFITGSSSANAAFWANSSPLTANGISLSGTNGSSSSYSYYDGNVVRFYQNNSFTLTPLSGVTITKVEIVRQSTTGSNSGTINCSGLTASNNNTTTNTNVFTGSATSAVTFTAAAQARFTEIKVYSTSDGVLPTIYTVTIADNITNGTVKASPTSAAKGVTVTLEATPATGYEFESWNVTGVTVEDATSATTTFTMPAANVNVSATFIPVQGGGEEVGTTSYSLIPVQSTGNTAYATYYDVTIDGVKWNAPGNQNFSGYWRIGGKSLTNVERTLTSQNAIDIDVKTVTVTTNGVSNNNLIVNSISIKVYSDSEYKNLVEEQTIEGPKDISSIVFTKSEDKSWNSCYYKIVFNLSNSKTSNYGVDLTKVTFSK